MQNKLPLNLAAKPQNFYYLIPFLTVRDMGVALLAVSGSGYLMRLQWRHGLGLHSCLELEGLLPRSLVHGVVGWRPQFLAVSSVSTRGLNSSPHGPPSRGIHNIVTNFLLSEHGGSISAFCDLVSKIAHHHFCLILFSESLSPAHIQRRKIWLYLLKGGIFKILWTYFKTATRT